MTFRSVQNVKKKFPLYQYLSDIVVGKYAESHAYYLVCNVIQLNFHPFCNLTLSYNEHLFVVN